MGGRQHKLLSWSGGEGRGYDNLLSWSGGEAWQHAWLQGKGSHDNLMVGVKTTCLDGLAGAITMDGKVLGNHDKLLGWSVFNHSNFG